MTLYTNQHNVIKTEVGKKHKKELLNRFEDNLANLCHTKSSDIDNYYKLSPLFKACAIGRFRANFRTHGKDFLEGKSLQGIRRGERSICEAFCQLSFCHLTFDVFLLAFTANVTLPSLTANITIGTYG